MALEAGSAMHEVFAACRIWQLEHKQKLKKHAIETATRIFTAPRWRTILNDVDTSLDTREQLLQLCFGVLHSGGFYDDPNDNVRTLGNMELATIVYVDEIIPKMDNWSIWVADKKNPKAAVGIEQVFDVVLTFSDGKIIRYIGTIDGLVIDHYRKDRPTLDENKTASRLDDGWITSFDLSHQVTGYLACSAVVFGFPIWHSRVTGLKIKPTNKGEDVYPKLVSRTPESMVHWARWVYFTVNLYETYKDNYEEAPRFTHSCNRYFRPCSLTSFCASNIDERRGMWDSMSFAEPSPSERAVMEI